MKVGDMVKWRNGKSFSGGVSDIMNLDESWFNYAVVIEVKPEENESGETPVDVLFEGKVMELPATILSLADDPHHIGTVLKKQKTIRKSQERRKCEGR